MHLGTMLHINFSFKPLDVVIRNLRNLRDTYQNAVMCESEIDPL